MAPLCGRQLSPADRRVWNQTIAMLMGLKIRNGFGEKELTAAVGMALHRGAAKHNCEDCGVKVAGIIMFWPATKMSPLGLGPPRRPPTTRPRQCLAPCRFEQ